MFVYQRVVCWELTINSPISLGIPTKSVELAAHKCFPDDIWLIEDTPNVPWSEHGSQWQSLLLQIPKKMEERSSRPPKK